MAKSTNEDTLGTDTRPPATGGVAPSDASATEALTTDRSTGEVLGAGLVTVERVAVDGKGPLTAKAVVVTKTLPDGRAISEYQTVVLPLDQQRFNVSVDAATQLAATGLFRVADDSRTKLKE